MIADQMLISSDTQDKLGLHSHSPASLLDSLLAPFHADGAIVDGTS